MNYNDINDLMLIISTNPDGYASFLNEFIPEIKDTQTFTLFGDIEPLLNFDLITKHDRLFTPWLNQNYEIPTKDFGNYQAKVIPILNQFIELKKEVVANILIPYPLNQDSEGNRFVLKSLIDLAFRNKKFNEWLIFSNFNYSDFEILNHIKRHLSKTDKVVILMDDESQVDEISFENKKHIETDNTFKVITVKTP